MQILIYIGIILFFAVFVPDESRAEPWEFSSVTLSEEDMSYLRNRYPVIRTPADLQSLLVEVSRIQPLLKIKAELDEGVITLRAIRAKPIAEIDVESTSYQMETEIAGRLQHFLGLVDANEIKQSIVVEATRHLKSRGFYKSIISTSIVEKEKWVKVVLKIEEDYPCRIRQIILGFKLPESVQLDIEEGDICDERNLADAMEVLEEDLADEGYNQRKILRPEMNYDRGTNSALVLLRGSLGRKVIYNIDSPVREFLNEELSEIDSTLVDPAAMSAEILRKYREAGYDDVVVKPAERTMVGDDTILYNFKVMPGPKYSITNIEFQGARYFQAEKLLDTVGFEGVFSTPLNEKMIREGIQQIKALYQLQGFWDVDVQYPRITKDARTGDAKLVFIINEGKQRVLDRLKIEGSHHFVKEEIQGLLDVEVGNPLAFASLGNFEKQLKNLYRGAGFVYAKFEINLLQNRTFRVIQTRVVVKITEGVRAKFGEVKVTGLFETDENVVTRELRFEPGDWYNPLLVEESQKALIQLGIFSNVNIVLSDSLALVEKRESLPHSIIVREGKPGSVAFGPGWSFVDGIRYVIESSYSNIGGTGRKIFFKGKISEESTQERISNKTLLGRVLSVGYLEPYIFDFPADGTVSVNHRANSNQRRWELSRSGEVAVSHQFRHFMKESKIAAFYGQNITTLETNERVKTQFIDTGNIRIGRVGVRFSADERDNLAWPTDGFKLDAETAWADYAFGGDLRYFRWNVKASFFWGILDHLVFALGIGMTSYEDIERKGEVADLIPTSERLQTGGADSNRGFPQRSLGPKFFYYEQNEDGSGYSLQDTPSGGSAKGVYKFELRYQFDNQIGFAFFTDISNVFFSRRQESRFKSKFLAAYDGLEGDRPDGPNYLTENLPYGFEDILGDPKDVLAKSYLSSGLAFNFITPLGSVDFSYGLPHSRCPKASPRPCDERGESKESKILSGQFYVSIGANF